MYLWKVNDLVNDLREEKVTESESAKYVILLGVLYALGSDPIFSIGLEYTVFDTISTLIVVISTFIGTYYCYSKNRSGDNKEFLSRYICLSVPISMRLIVIIIPIALLIGLLFTPDWPGIDSAEPVPDTYTTDMETVALIAFVQIFFFWYVSHSIEKVAGPQSA